MPAKIKVDSSNWGNVTDIQVKTSSNTWGYAKSAWVKTDASTWVRWFLGPVIDSFNRSTSGTLGTAETSEAWTNISGTWYANGSAAQSDTAASSYPIASINYGVSDVTIAAAVGQGTGVAAWISDANNWYALVPYQTQVNTTYSCNCSCNGHCESYSYPVYNSCANCSACGSTQSSVTTDIGAATYSAGTITSWSYYESATLSYSCPNGGTLSGTRCNIEGTTTYVYTKVSKGCYSGFSGCNSPYSEEVAPGICGCPTGQNKVCCYQFEYVPVTTGGSSYTATATYSCSVGETGHPGAYSCYTPNYSGGGYSCSSGTLCNTNRCCSTTSTVVCGTCQNSSCGVSYYASGTACYGGGTYPNCDQYGGSCQTCGTLSNSYYVRLLRSVGGVITNLTGDISLGSAVNSLRLSTQGNVLSYQAYSDSNFSSLLTSGSVTATSPTITNNHGIIKSPSSYGQSSTVDNFRVSG